MKKLWIVVSAMSAVIMGAGAGAQERSTNSDPPVSRLAQNVPADNSKSNQLDPSNRAVTADKQSNAASDLDLVKRIRQSVVADKGLSTYAHNVKIVAAEGSVTLNGVVRSEDEKSNIYRKAAAVAGEGHVKNNLKVANK